MLSAAASKGAVVVVRGGSNSRCCVAVNMLTTTTLCRRSMVTGGAASSISAPSSVPAPAPATEYGNMPGERDPEEIRRMNRTGEESIVSVVYY